MIFFAPNFQMLQTWVIQTRLNQRFHGSVALLAFISKLISRILAAISKKTGPERCVNCDFTNIFSGQVDFEKSNPEKFLRFLVELFEIEKFRPNFIKCS